MPDWILAAIAALQDHNPDLYIEVVVDPDSDTGEPCLLVRKEHPSSPAQQEH